MSNQEEVKEPDPKVVEELQADLWLWSKENGDPLRRREAFFMGSRMESRKGDRMKDIKKGFSIYLNVENVKALLEADSHFFDMGAMDEGEEFDAEDDFRSKFNKLISKVKAEKSYRSGR